jgi:FtsP/CotA-like multicopper oxidase with cupredoxin domain
VVEAPAELRSVHGVLETTMVMRSVFDSHRVQRFCYISDGKQAPTLRVHPGDMLIIHFENDLSTDIHPQTAFPNAARHPALMTSPALPSAENPADAPCFATSMSATGSNLHFHGLGVAPLCHQDEVIHTMVRAGQSFDYLVQIAVDESPGLYWYHPHPHGYSEAQVLGGASGALIVEGANPRALPERTLVLRDQLVREGVAEAHAADKDLPTWDVSLNYVPVMYPEYEPARMEVAADQSELWRMVNAGADQILDLQYVVNGTVQPFEVRERDGVALRNADGSARTEQSMHLRLPPGARIEAVVRTPRMGEHAELRTLRVDTGPDGESVPARVIAEVVASVKSGGAEMQVSPLRPAASGRDDKVLAGRDENSVRSGEAARSAAEARGVYQRRLYFSELNHNPGDKEGYTEFFLTVEGQAPKQYEMGQAPNITVHRGAVEEWTIENRSREVHVFHIHQMHFRVVSVDGKPSSDNAMLDTYEMPYWTGVGAYPSVRVRLEFSSPKLVGTFLYHCHILGHEDAGMMGAIEVLPRGFATSVKMEGRTAIVSSSTKGIAPTGSVQFQQGGRVIAESAVKDGRAVMSGASAGGAVTAVYSGDTFFEGSSAVTH